MSKMTIYKLAQMLDMTPSMVSRAFSPSGKVSPEKRELILETARKYDFVPNKMASRLSMKSISIGIVINTSFKINADKMVRGIEAAYENLKDYKISYDITLLENAKENDENCRNALLNYADYDGVIIAPIQRRNKRTLRKKSQRRAGAGNQRKCRLPLCIKA